MDNFNESSILSPSTTTIAKNKKKDTCLNKPLKT
jgi:hypothetical protein